jgi:hypothetical protein
VCNANRVVRFRGRGYFTGSGRHYPAAANVLHLAAYSNYPRNSSRTGLKKVSAAKSFKGRRDARFSGGDCEARSLSRDNRAC